VNYNAWSFWLLFGCVILFYWRLNHRQQNRWLLAASYFFYAFWDYRFLFLILISTLIDFIGGLGVAGTPLPASRLRRLFLLLVGSALVLCTNVQYGVLWSGLLTLDGTAIMGALPQRARDFAIPAGTVGACLLYWFLLRVLYRAPAARRRTYFLAVSMIANLVILGFFKYFDFFLTSLVTALHAIGFSNVSVHPLGLILPVGISFYTFQAMSYTIDIYRGEAKPTEDVADFALFVCFFPHLVAGPIMRAHTLLPQVVNPRRLAPGAVEEGLLLVTLGLIKKVVIADNLAPIANAVFFRFADGQAETLTSLDVLVGLYAFAFQIYGDFSGYSAIARGISKWLGFELIINFDQPYLAVSPSDFWRRWHISLSTWLRDYLYISLGGNRFGTRRTYLNLILTMLLGGLWHGASWTFVSWGLYHGVLLCLFRATGVRDLPCGGRLAERFEWATRVVIMFHLTCLGWLLFRADSFRTIVAMCYRLITSFAGSSFALSALVTLVLYCGPLIVLEWFLSGERDLPRLMDAAWPVRTAAYGLLAVILVVFSAGLSGEFIYFQF
jgi:alginate O-acetyltransferase complex protein AlgI